MEERERERREKKQEGKRKIGKYECDENGQQLKHNLAFDYKY